MIKKITFISLFIWCIHFFNAQAFSWQNPNLKNDSIGKSEKLVKKLENDWFTKDTIDFISPQKEIVLEDAILAKYRKKKVFGELDTKGAIIRGIRFGNNQGSSVQSSMDLKINGQLSKDIKVTASIYDQNLPVQADGYTQTINEFDKIYIQLDIKDHTKINAGHIDLDNNDVYFARYQRRSMGLGVETRFGNEHKTKLNISAGVARSEFQRMRFQGIEGNQGPYRLKGKNNELFISIIPDSEEVYIDGLLLKRGEKNDYIINYNTGEITFTTFRPIFKQNFITISYNYTNRNYSRYLVTGGVEHQREKWKTNFTWFLENDNKNTPLGFNLSEEDKKILSLAGNNSDLMYAPSGQLTDYDVNKVLYKKTPFNNSFYYEYSSDENEELYQVNFTFFGEQKGDYNIKQTINNGRIFEYVGTNNGAYKAVRKLTAPKKSQVFSTQSVYELKNGSIGVDFSLSNRDENLFSSLDAGENVGYAGRIFAFKKFKQKNWSILPKIEFQHINKNFHVLDRINSVEFSRDFNLTQEFNNRTQNRLIFSLLNEWNTHSFFDYTLNYLDEKNFYSGIKNAADFGWKIGKFNTTGKTSYLKTESDIQNTTFIEGEIISTFSKPKGNWSVGASMEHNIKKINSLNQYDTSSFSWKEIFLGKKIGDSLRNYLDTKVYYRSNDSIQNNQLSNVNHLVGIQASSQIIKTEKTTLSTLLHYRKFYYSQPEQNTNQDFIIGNITFNQKLWNDGLRLQAFYELGNGQEAQREFQYIKVTDGQGIYRWTDYNGDGVQQLDEFEVAEYSDLAQYIRVYTNGTRYLPSNKNGLKLNVLINPALISESNNSFLKRWQFNLSFLSNNSYFKENDAFILNPFKKSTKQILKNQNILALAKFKNTSSSGWNGSYRFMNNANFILANFSKEERLQKGHFVNIGYKFNDYLDFDWENSFQQTENKSQQFSLRNYLLNTLTSKPKITYLFSKSIQASLSSAFKNNTRKDGIEKLEAVEISGMLQWQTEKTSIMANLSFINNNFTGNNFSIVGNQMLNGLKTGKNQVWNLLLQQRINSFLQLNVNYEGRSSSERTIHTGSMQVKATF